MVEFENPETLQLPAGGEYGFRFLMLITISKRQSLNIISDMFNTKVVGVE